MIASLKILFQTRKAFEYLDEQYEDDLETNCTLIFGLLGAISGLNSYFKEKTQLLEHMDSRFMILFLIIAIAFGAVLGVLIGKYVTTYVLYGMSKLLKGSPAVIDLRVVAAYSMIPTIVYVPIILFFGIYGWEGIPKDYYWIFDLISGLVWIWVLKIMIQGVMKFSNLGFAKAILNISPILLIGIFRFILRYI
jgi:hypothetical protein